MSATEMETQNSGLNPSAVIGCLNGIEQFIGENFPSWKEQILLFLGVMDLDYALREKAPNPPAAPAPSDEKQLAEQTKAYEAAMEKWSRSNRMALMVMKSTIPIGIRAAIPESNDSQAYLASVEEQFRSCIKIYASTLMMRLIKTKYDGVGSIREYLMTMMDIAARLKGMDEEISEGFLVLFIMASLPAEYGPFTINYFMLKEKWTLSELTAMCVREEERLKAKKKDCTRIASMNSGKRKFKGENNDPKKKACFSPKAEASKFRATGCKPVALEE